MMLSIFASIVFVLYGIMAAHATYNLFGVGAIPFGVAITCGLLWEIWIQPVRDEKRRQKLLSDIEGMRFDIESPTNARTLFVSLKTEIDS